MVRKFLIILILLFGYASLSLAQKNAESNCSSELSFLTNKVKQNYAGFQDKTQNRVAELQALTDSLSSATKKVSNSAQCTRLLKKWIDFFDDSHLWLQSENKEKKNDTEPAKATSNPSLKYLDKQTAYMRISSFSLKYKSSIDSLLNANWNKLIHTPKFIIDIRDNAGGGDPSFAKLLPLIYTNPYELKGVEVRATHDNIKHFSSLVKRDEFSESIKKELREIVKRMRGNEGTFVTIAEDHIVRRDTTYDNPKHVAILIDGGVYSSAEQFLINAKHSNKTTVFGNPTGGAIDYANLNIMELPSGFRKVGIPTTRSRRLPENPIDQSGIAPDVLIPKDVQNWISFTRGYLMGKN